MTVESFERFVEVVVQHNRSVAEVLSEYQEDCANLELSGTMADSFKNVELREESSYAASLLRGMWPLDSSWCINPKEIDNADH
jgi:hypothetical protein